MNKKTKNFVAVLLTLCMVPAFFAIQAQALGGGMTKNSNETDTAANTQTKASQAQSAAATTTDMGIVAATNTAYAVTYVEGNQFTVANMPDDAADIQAGTVYTIPGKIPLCDGYTFTGWETADVAGSQRIYFSGESFAMPEKNVVLTATWAEGPRYMVTYVSGTDDTVTDMPLTAAGIPPDVEYVISGKIPQRKGFNFDGWESTSVTGVLTDYPAGGSFAMPTNNVILTAKWVPLPKSAVIFLPGTADRVTELPASEPSVLVGDMYTIPEKTPERTGYIFNGWETQDVTGTLKTYEPGESFIMPETDVQLTATWVIYSGKNSTAVLLQMDATNNAVTLPGAVLKLFQKAEDEDLLIGTYTTDEDGKIKVIALAPGEYYWQEITPPEGYLLDSIPHPFVLIDLKTTTVTRTSQPTKVPNLLNGNDHFAYIVGYANGTVCPNENITRAEVATIFFRLLKDEVRDENITAANSFTDVHEKSWYNVAISTMAELGIINGYPDDTFRPNNTITRAEFAAIAARFDTIGEEYTITFTDISGYWAEAEIMAAADKGWVNGYSNGTFRPRRPITRAEAVTLVNRMLQRLPENTGDLLEDMKVWTDNANTGAWYYLAIQEATNSHYYQYKENGTEKWTELRDNRDWNTLSDDMAQELEE